MQQGAKRERSAGTWLWQALTGVLVVVLLGLHMIANHFVAAGGLRNYQEVLAYIRTPIITVFELAFLVVVVYHALLGVRAVITDLGLTRDRENVVNRVLTVIGVAAVAYGVFLTWTLLTRV